MTFLRQIYPKPGREVVGSPPSQEPCTVGISCWPPWAGPGPASLSLVVSVEAETAVESSACEEEGTRVF